MGLLNRNIFSTGFMKKAKFLTASTQRAQSIIMISETGVISKEVLPMDTGYMSAPDLRMSWVSMHKLKLAVRNKNGEVENDPILLISERSYLPLDPLGRLTKKEEQDITPLSSVAKVIHAGVRASVGSRTDTSARDRLLQAVANGGLILIGVIAICFFAVRMWGGH